MLHVLLGDCVEVINLFLCQSLINDWQLRKGFKSYANGKNRTIKIRSIWMIKSIEKIGALTTLIISSVLYM